MIRVFCKYQNIKKNKPKNNLYEIELQVLNSLLQEKDIIMQKADKGSTIAVIDKNAYKKKMISDRSELPFQIVLNLKSLIFKKKSI